MTQIPQSSSDSFPNSFGWNEFFQASFQKDRSEEFIIGRVVSQGRGHYRVQVSSDREVEAAVTSKFHNSSQTPSDFPAVGDWVTLTLGPDGGPSSIHRVLGRKNSVQRKRLGAKSDMQIIATNIDYLLIVSSCNEDFDLERLGRYVDLGQQNDCTTVFLLTKADLCPDPDEYIRQCKAKFANVEAVAISTRDPKSLEDLHRFFSRGQTSVLVGSSGVGKSTLTNFLLGFEGQKTQAVSSESKGRHTTTSRNLKMTRWGGLVIDTPGMQDITADNDGDLHVRKFSDVEDMALACKFTDCQHNTEPGCAIRQALKSGILTKDRWEEYLGFIKKNAFKGKRATKEGRRSR
jgi:ribosome biogenesis GTPase